MTHHIPELNEWEARKVRAALRANPDNEHLHRCFAEVRFALDHLRHAITLAKNPTPNTPQHHAQDSHS